jgi:hypothetical protein
MEDLSNTVFQPSVSPIGADGEQRDRVLIIGNDGTEAAGRSRDMGRRQDR